jgi:hypothetical protein
MAFLSVFNMDTDFVKPVKSYEDIELAMEELPKKQELSETPRKLDATVDNTNKNFKGQQKNEVVHSFTRRHWIVLVPSFINLILVIGCFVFLLSISKNSLTSVFSTFAYKVTAILSLGILTYFFHRFFDKVFNYYIQILVVTNFRIVILDQTLFFYSQRDSIDLNQIQDIGVQRGGIIKTILNYGELTISLSTSHATKVLRCVPNPEYFFRKINKIKREYITQRRIEKNVSPIPGTNDSQ